MSAATRIEASVWGDLRYDHLAALLGVSKYEIVGRMAHLWGYCTERLAHALAPAAVDTIVDHKKLIEADLAEMQNDGLVRIKGTKGRIEWLEKKRRAASKGGKARGKQLKKSRVASALAPAKVVASPATTPLALALTLTNNIESTTYSLAHFQRAYESYPVKKGKAKGIEKARKLIRTKADFEVFEAACGRMGELWKNATPRQREFCPHFSTFVNQERWRDEELPAPKPDEAGGGNPSVGHYRHTGAETYADGEVKL